VEQEQFRGKRAERVARNRVAGALIAGSRGSSLRQIEETPPPWENVYSFDVQYSIP